MIWGLYPDWFEGFVNLVPLPRLGPAVNRDRVTAELLKYSSTLGVPDSVYARFKIVSDTCHPAPYYVNSDKPFLTLSDQYRNPERGFVPGT